MDPELLALLQRLNDENAEPLTDEELSQLRDGLRAVGAGIDPSAATQEDIDALAEAAEHLERVNSELASREEARAERETQARELLGRLGTEAEGETEGAEGAAEGEPAEGTGETGTEGEGTETTEGAEGAGTEAETAEPVAAAGAPARRPALPPIHHLARRRPNRAAPAPTQTAETGDNRPVLTAAADLPGLAAGMEIEPERWAQGCVRRMEAVRKVKVPGADGEKIYFGTIDAKPQYETQGRMLTDDEARNREIMEGVVGREALAASGGVCGPVAVDYSLTTLGVADRPVRQALAQFGAARGGVRYILPHTLAAVTSDGPAAIWTEATDVNPGASTKPHATFLCQAVQEAYVDAVTSIIQFGNFQARYFPEQIQQYLDTADAVHARLAEATLLAAIGAGSTAVTADNYEIGAARDLLHTLDRAAAAYRWRHRMRPDSPLRLILPAYVLDMVRADLALNMPGDSGGQAERLATANAEIESFIRARNINVSWTLDSFTGANPLQGFGTQGAGQLTPWPLTTYGWLFHEGAWMFLDGGELNLGMVRDSVLNKTNDFQMFSETFEKAIFRGHESIQLALKIDPTGASVGTVAPTGGGLTIGS